MNLEKKTVKMKEEAKPLASTRPSDGTPVRVHGLRTLFWFFTHIEQKNIMVVLTFTVSDVKTILCSPVSFYHHHRSQHYCHESELIMIKDTNALFYMS